MFAPGGVLHARYGTSVCQRLNSSLSTSYVHSFPYMTVKMAEEEKRAHTGELSSGVGLGDAEGGEGTEGREEA